MLLSYGTSRSTSHRGAISALSGHGSSFESRGCARVSIGSLYFAYKVVYKIVLKRKPRVEVVCGVKISYAWWLSCATYRSLHNEERASRRVCIFRTDQFNEVHRRLIDEPSVKPGSRVQCMAHRSKLWCALFRLIHVE